MCTTKPIFSTVVLAALCAAPPLLAQSLDASMPAKEYIYSGGRLLAVVAQDNTGGGGGGGGSYTTDHLEAFWKFDEGSGTTLNDSAGTYNGTISGTPDWTTDPTGLYASNADTGATSFGASGNQLSATSGQDYTVIWVGKVASPGAYQTVWSMGLNSLVYAEGGPNHNFRIYVNGYSNYISYSAYLDKTIMLTVRSSNGGTTVQGRIGTGSWQTLSSIGPWNNPVQGMRFGIDYNGAYTSTTLTESLMWVYSDDLTDAEVAANFNPGFPFWPSRRVWRSRARRSGATVFCLLRHIRLLPPLSGRDWERRASLHGLGRRPSPTPLRPRLSATRVRMLRASPRQPPGAGSAANLASISPNSWRLRRPSANKSQ